MMRLLSIVFLLSTLSIFAQVPGGSVNPAVSFAVESNGHKVGKGVCFDLVREAAEKINRNWYKEVWCNSRVKTQAIVAVPESGDIISFSGVVMKSGARYSSHIGIVCQVINDSLLVIAHQNVCTDKTPKKTIRYYGEKRTVCSNSVVAMEVINIRERVKGKIVYYAIK